MASPAPVTPARLLASEEAPAHSHLATPQTLVHGALTRAGSTPGSTRPLTADAWPGKDALLGAVRRQMESLEERLNVKISRSQQQGERLRDAMLARVDQKMGGLESLQPRLDRRVAELSGNCKGLSDEMQAQIKRIDQLESRMWDWRHQLEEEMRGKFQDLDQNQQQACSAWRLAGATSEDQLKRANQRMLRLEDLVHERLAHVEGVTQSLQGFHDRLTEVEGMRAQEISIAPRQEHTLSSAGLANGKLLAALDTRLTGACRKLEALQQERHDLHVLVEAQEERMKSMRTQLDMREEQHRSLSDRIERSDVEGRVRELQAQLSDLERHRADNAESLEQLHKRLEGHEQVQETFGEGLGQFAVNSPPSAQSHDLHDQGSAAQECLRRLEQAEARLDTVMADVEVMRESLQLGPNVAALVEQLRLVAPAVAQHEVHLRDLREKVGPLGDGGLMARLGHLEMEVARIKSDVEGTDMPSVHGNELVELASPP